MHNKPLPFRGGGWGGAEKGDKGLRKRMELLWTAIISALVALLASYFAYWLAGKPRQIAFSPSSTFFELKSSDPNTPPIPVRAGQVIVQNNGRLRATDIQFIAEPGAPPRGYNLVPSVAHAVGTTASGEWLLELPYLAPGESITLQILSGPNIASVRAKEAVIRQVPVVHQRLYPAWFNALVLGLVLTGVVTVVYSVWYYLVEPLI